MLGNSLKMYFKTLAKIPNFAAQLPIKQLNLIKQKNKN